MPDDQRPLESTETPLNMIEESPLYVGQPWFDYLNIVWVPIYSLVSVLFLIAIYRMVRNEWEWHGGIAIVLNLVATFLFFPILRAGGEIAVMIGTMDIIIMWLAGIWFSVFVFRRSWIMGLLMIPYLLWSTYVCVIMIEVLRLY
jgi:tryptophan-rich sensory protein